MFTSVRGKTKYTHYFSAWQAKSSPCELLVLIAGSEDRRSALGTLAFLPQMCLGLEPVPLSLHPNGPHPILAPKVGLGIYLQFGSTAFQTACGLKNHVSANNCKYFKHVKSSEHGTVIKTIRISYKHRTNAHPWIPSGRNRIKISTYLIHFVLYILFLFKI